jgi:hypothetical protein
MKKPVLLIAIFFLFLIGLLHLVRLILKIEVTVAGANIPVWISLFGCIFPAGLAVLLWRENHDKK